MNTLRSLRRLALPAAFAIAALAAAPAAAQVSILDEGSLTLYREGRRVGREDFSIRTTAGAVDLALLSAQATITLEDRRLLPALSATAAGVPTGYQLEEQIARQTESRWSLQLGSGRAVVRLKDKKGESSSEFFVTGAPVLVDDDVQHHLYFLLRRTHDGTVSVMVPRRNVVLSVRVKTTGADSVSVGGRSLSATRLAVESSDARFPSREVWVDAAGRLLKVAVSGSGLTAIRDETPRAVP